MRKIARIFVFVLLGSAIGLLSFGITTILSSAFFQTTAAENNEAAAINEAIRDVAALTPSINPAVSPQYDSPDYGFTYLTYRVKRGDNLTDIARRHSGDLYKISTDEIGHLNGIKNPNRILAGQKLRLPMYYAKEVQAVAPAMVHAAVEAAVAPKEAELAKAESIKWTLLYVIATLVILFAFFAWGILSDNNKTEKVLPETISETPEPEKFLTYPDEIKAMLPKCTGQEIAEILESEFVEIPRGPGSTATNKVKVKNVQDLMKKYPELLSMHPESWNAHLAAKMNGVAPASAESA